MFNDQFHKKIDCVKIYINHFKNANEEIEN